jgi:hypothetical protein
MADKNSQGWRKYFKVADTSGQLSPISGKNQYVLDGYAKNVMGNDPHPRYDLADDRIAETGWFA